MVPGREFFVCAKNTTIDTCEIGDAFDKFLQQRRYSGITGARMMVHNEYRLFLAKIDI